jgi:hypothetical protein
MKRCSIKKGSSVVRLTSTGPIRQKQLDDLWPCLSNDLVRRAFAPQRAFWLLGSGFPLIVEWPQARRWAFISR